MISSTTAAARDENISIAIYQNRLPCPDAIAATLNIYSFKYVSITKIFFNTLFKKSFQFDFLFVESFKSFLVECFPLTWSIPKILLRFSINVANKEETRKLTPRLLSTWQRVTDCFGPYATDQIPNKILQPRTIQCTKYSRRHIPHKLYEAFRHWRKSNLGKDKKHFLLSLDASCLHDH